MKKWLRLQLINFLTKHLFNTISESDILRTTKTGVYVGTSIVSKEHLSSLAGQAESILISDVWKLVVDDMKYIANKRIYLDSQSMDDVIAGKLILWMLDVITRKFYSVSQMK